MCVYHNLYARGRWQRERAREQSERDGAQTRDRGRDGPSRKGSFSGHRWRTLPQIAVAMTTMKLCLRRRHHRRLVPHATIIYFYFRYII